MEHINQDVTSDDFLKRIKELIKKVGGSESAARIIGKSPATIERYKKNGGLAFEDALKLVTEAGYTTQWLAYGDNQPNFTLDDGSHPMRYVPLINLVASAGGGSLVTEEKATSLLAFHKYYLEKEWSIYSAKLFCMEVSGDSMEPTLIHNEILICSYDLGDLSSRDGVYVLRLDGNILVKRLQFLPSNKVKVLSDNKLYDAYEISINDGIDFDILGKVLLVNGLRRV